MAEAALVLAPLDVLIFFNAATIGIFFQEGVELDIAHLLSLACGVIEPIGPESGPRRIVGRLEPPRR